MNFLRKLLNLFRRPRVVVPVYMEPETPVEVRVGPLQSYSSLRSVIRDIYELMDKHDEVCVPVTNVVKFAMQRHNERGDLHVDYRITRCWVRNLLHDYPALRIERVDTQDVIMKGERKYDYQI